MTWEGRRTGCPEEGVELGGEGGREGRDLCALGGAAALSWGFRSGGWERRWERRERKKEGVWGWDGEQKAQF